MTSPRRRSGAALYYATPWATRSPWIRRRSRPPTAPPAALASGRAAPNETQPAGALASGGSAGSIPSAGAPSPIEVALAWHEREHARLRGVLSHPPRELRDAPTPELAFEVEKTILSPAKSAASGGGGVAAAREDLRGAVAAARAAAAKASPARQQLHWNEPPSPSRAPAQEPPSPSRAPAPIYESSPSVSSAEDDDGDAPTPRTTPPTPAFGAGASRAYDNPMADAAEETDGEELAREAAAARAEREAEAAAAAFAERVDRAYASAFNEEPAGVQRVQHVLSCKEV